MRAAELAGWIARLAPSEVLVAADLPEGSFEPGATTAHPPPRVAVRRGARAAQAAGATARRLARRLRRGRAGDCPRGGRGAADLCRAHPGPGAGPRAAADGAARQRADRPAADDPSQPRADQDPARPGRADRCSRLLDGCATGMGSRALRLWLTQPRRERQVASQRHEAIAALHDAGLDALRGDASPPCRRRTDHRPDRPAPGSPARARRPARDAAGVAAGACRHSGRRRAPALDVRRRRCRRPTRSCALLAGGAGRGARGAGARRRRDRCRPRRRARRAARHRPRQRRLPARARGARDGQRTGIANLRVQFNRRARLLHRGHAGPGRQGAGRLPAPADAEERRALHHARAQGLRGQGAVGAASGRWRARSRSTTHCSTHLRPSCRAAARRWPAPWRRSMRWPRWPSVRQRSDWCRPQFVREPGIEIERGRHPVVEARLAETAASAFIANDCRLDAKRRMLVITGPNMGGKSHLHAPGRADLPARLDRLVRAGRPPAGSGRSTRSTPASAPPTTWPTRSRPSWSR